MFSAFSFDGSALRRLLLLDILIIGIHVICGFAVLSGFDTRWPDFLNIGRDWSAGEILNYTKWVLLLTVLFRYYRQSSDKISLALSVLFAVSLLDDSLRLHEAGGDFLVERWGATAENESVISFAGEFLVWCVAGTIVAAVLVKAWRQASVEERARALPSLALFSFVVFFAVVLDFVHSLSVEKSLVAGLLGLLEDGGEMLALSLLTAHVFQQYRATERVELNPPVLRGDGLTKQQP